MTREQFVEKAVRKAEIALHVPAGWWGTYLDVHAPGGIRVRWSGSRKHWVVSHDGKILGRNDRRTGAIARAKRLLAERPTCNGHNYHVFTLGADKCSVCGTPRERLR